MRAMLLTAIFALAGCDGQVTNTAAPYAVVTGAIDLKWTPTVEGAKTVEFQVGGKTVGKDTDGSDGFVFQIDSTKLANGLQTLGIIARGADNGVLLKAEHSIFIAN
ncbi:MAG: hypothetical protein JWM80_1170 [Cyanobacteria bacterium RYN_339]|nr:hypothetical protein [Cyanobacteria bacterium RYN_339]